MVRILVHGRPAGLSRRRYVSWQDLVLVVDAVDSAALIAEAAV
ncbi:hypothetical protein [Streptomyces regalis]|nr:hypothetical protein [Streptomyces regalis]